MRLIGFFAGVLLVYAHCFPSVVQAESRHLCTVDETGVAASSRRLPQPQPTRGCVNALVVFAQFKDEAGTGVAPFADLLFDPSHPGSFAHFYQTMSFGRLEVHGTVLPKRYVSDQPAAAYLADQADERGKFGDFALEIIRQVDADIDLGRFDNDGPDGIANSGDDDARVDYVFIVMQSIPSNFIHGPSEATAGLNFKPEYQSKDLAATGAAVRVNASRFHGAVVKQGSLAQTVGLMAHEFGHSLGLPDLYAAAKEVPAEDSAGIGRWGLMGWGAYGWKDDDGPTAFCAWSLEKLGWIGRANDRLVEVVAGQHRLSIADLYADGSVYKIPLRNHFFASGSVYAEEYLLLEQRTHSSHYYNRHLPNEGLLVWHIRPQAGNNNDEAEKLVDLVCADGTYGDKGYPLGKIVDGRSGRDNLDFWADNRQYRQSHKGNRGDATDVFDGVVYTEFGVGTNPSTDIGAFLPAASSGLQLRNMHRRGAAMVVDIELPRWSGRIDGQVDWMGTVVVDGDLEIAPQGKVTVYGHTRVRFAGTDRLRRGLDPGLIELVVEGELKIHSGTLTRYDRHLLETIKPGSAVFESLEFGASWAGIFPSTAAIVDVPEGSLELSDARFGLMDPGAPLPVATLVPDESAQEPTGHHLLGNYPNPFNPQTTIRFALPQLVPVRLAVYNMLGQEIRALVEGRRAAGEHEVVWDGRDAQGRPLASGTYLYRLEVAGATVATRQMALLR